MNRGLVIALVAAVLVLALGQIGLGAWVFLGPGRTAVPPQEETTAEILPGSEDTVFFETDNFVTDLADKDRLRYVDVSVSLAMRNERALETAKQLEPQIRDAILGQLRLRTAPELAGSAGKDDLSAALQSALSNLLGDGLVKVYITDLVIQ